MHPLGFALLVPAITVFLAAVLPSGLARIGSSNTQPESQNQVRQTE